MISDELLDRYRQEDTEVRVVRDILESNDVYGIVVAWDEQTVMIRKKSRRIVKLKRQYGYQPADEPRQLPEGLLD
ncbi:hypothetical protein [Paenibacillus marinisediminis]